MKDDKELRFLLRQSARGNTGAFSALVRELQDPVWRFAYSIMGNKEDAEDVAQETFLKLWQKAAVFRGDASVMSFVLTMTKNTALDELRRKRGRPFASLTVLDDDGEERQAELADPEDSPEREYLRKERREAVRDAISQLPREARVILTLRDMEGRSYHEISSVLGLNEGTVKSRLFRARQQLREILEKQNFF